MTRLSDSLMVHRPYGGRTRSYHRRSLTDGSYDVFVMAHGVIEFHSLPGVTIDLDTLFAADM